MMQLQYRILGSFCQASNIPETELHWYSLLQVQHQDLDKAFSRRQYRGFGRTSRTRFLLPAWVGAGWPLESSKGSYRSG
jgi:hypothetical protein